MYGEDFWWIVGNGRLGGFCWVWWVGWRGWWVLFVRNCLNEGLGERFVWEVVVWVEDGLSVEMGRIGEDLGREGRIWEGGVSWGLLWWGCDKFGVMVVVLVCVMVFSFSLRI